MCRADDESHGAVSIGSGIIQLLHIAYSSQVVFCECYIDGVLMDFVECVEIEGPFLWPMRSSVCSWKCIKCHILNTLHGQTYVGPAFVL